MNPEDWIAQFEEGNLSSYGLLEAFGRFEKWIVGIEKLETGGFIPLVWKDEEGQGFLNVFSRMEYMQGYANIWGKEFRPEFYLSLPGYWIFQNLPTGISYINLDSEAEHTIHYKKHQFSTLQEIGKMIEIDLSMRRILQTPMQDFSKIKEEFQQLLDYKNYYLVFADSKMPLAPDDMGRRLIPAFTSELSAKLFTDWLESNHDIKNLHSVKHSGKEFFTRLKSMQADGIAFNCSGPITPCGFVMDLAEQVLG